MAEDLHQQVWLSVLEHIDRFDTASATAASEPGCFGSPRTRPTISGEAQPQVKVTEGLRLVVEAEGDSPESSHRLLATEESQKLRRAIEQLPAAQREVVCMRYYGNLKFAQIAQTLGCPLNTALGRMHKALAGDLAD